MRSGRNRHARADDRNCALSAMDCIDAPRLSGRALHAFGHLFLCILQHLRSIHVLPPAVAYIDGSDFIIAGHQLNCVSQAAIVPAAAGLRPLEIVEDFQRDKRTSRYQSHRNPAGFSRCR